MVQSYPNPNFGKPPVKISPPLTTAQREAQAKAAAKKREQARKDRLSPSKMTPAQKAAYLNNPGMDNY